MTGFQIDAFNSASDWSILNEGDLIGWQRYPVSINVKTLLVERI